MLDIISRQLGERTNVCSSWLDMMFPPCFPQTITVCIFYCFLGEFLAFFLFLHLLSVFGSANLCVRVGLVAVGKGSRLGWGSGLGRATESGFCIVSGLVISEAGEASGALRWLLPIWCFCLHRHPRHCQFYIDSDESIPTRNRSEVFHSATSICHVGPVKQCHCDFFVY